MEKLESLQKVEDLILYKDSRFFSSFPSIQVLQDGSAALFFRRARDVRWLLPRPLPKKFQDLDTSYDHLDSRSEIVMIKYPSELHQEGKPYSLSINVEAADQDPSVLCLSNGTIVLASFSWYPFLMDLEEVFKDTNAYLFRQKEGGGGFLFWGGFTRVSQDHGASWSPHQYLPKLPKTSPLIPYKRPFHGGAIRGQPVEYQGKIFLVTYTGPSLESYQGACNLFVSEDRGLSWLHRSTFAASGSKKEFFCEPSLFMTDSGKLWAFLRKETKKGTELATCVSTDEGQSWSEPKEHGVPGGPFHPLRLSNGLVFLSYGYRKKPYGIRARILDADCEEITSAEEIIIREDGFCEDVGYPWSVQLPDGRICCVYYFCSAGESLRYIACSIFRN